MHLLALLTFRNLLQHMRKQMRMLQSSGGQAAAGSQRNCSPAQDCVKQDRRQPSQHRSAASAEGDKADSYGYGFDVSTQKWYPTIHVEVEVLSACSRACKNTFPHHPLTRCCTNIAVSMLDVISMLKSHLHVRAQAPLMLKMLLVFLSE